MSRECVVCICKYWNSIPSSWCFLATCLYMKSSVLSGKDTCSRIYCTGSLRYMGAIPLESSGHVVWIYSFSKRSFETLHHSPLISPFCSLKCFGASHEKYWYGILDCGKTMSIDLLYGQLCSSLQYPETWLVLQWKERQAKVESLWENMVTVLNIDMRWWTYWTNMKIIVDWNWRRLLYNGQHCSSRVRGWWTILG